MSDPGNRPSAAAAANADDNNSHNQNQHQNQTQNQNQNQQHQTNSTVHVNNNSNNNNDRNNDNNNNNDNASQNSRSKSASSKGQGGANEEELARGLAFLAQIFAFAVAIIVLVLFAICRRDNFIYSMSMPTASAPADLIVKIEAVQILTAGNIYMYWTFLIGVVVVTLFNSFEIFREKVAAKYRKTQLVLNRVVSGAGVAVFVTVLPELDRWNSRRNLVADTSAALDAYNIVLAFWILLFLLPVFVLIAHAVCPEMDERRHDRVAKELANQRKYGGGGDDEEMSPFSHNPDQ